MLLRSVEIISIFKNYNDEVIKAKLNKIIINIINQDLNNCKLELKEKK